MSKLDESAVEWIIREKRKGRRNKRIVETAGVSIRWVQRLWARYKDSPNITYPLPMGRPVNGLRAAVSARSLLRPKVIGARGPADGGAYREGDRHTYTA